MALSGNIQIAMPFGCYETQTIDGKNRLLIPKPDRDELGANFVAALTVVGCLGLYRLADWLSKVNYARGFDTMNEGKETYTRLMFTGVKYGLNCDPQGRVVIPADIQERAKLSNPVLMMGCDDRIEVWNPEEFKKWRAEPKTYGLERRTDIKEAYEQMVAGGRPEMGH